MRFCGLVGGGSGVNMRLFGHQMVEFFDRWDRFGGTLAMVTRLLGDDKLTEWWIGALNERLNANPFEQTVEEQMTALRTQNDAWRARGMPTVSDEDLERLEKTAPAWPVGRDAHRSFTLRFGTGTEGMQCTFEAHAAAMDRVFGKKYWRWELLHSKPMPFNGKDVERLRLLSGNASHKPIVDWCIIPDLSAFRQRTDVTSVRGPKSLADQGLVLAWLNPKRVHAIDYKDWCAFFLGGYEVNVPGNVAGEWQRVVVVRRDVGTGRVDLCASWRGDGDSGYSVPPIG